MFLETPRLPLQRPENFKALPDAVGAASAGCCCSPRGLRGLLTALLGAGLGAQAEALPAELRLRAGHGVGNSPRTVERLAAASAGESPVSRSSTPSRGRFYGRVGVLRLCTTVHHRNPLWRGFAHHLGAPAGLIH